MVGTEKQIAYAKAILAGAKAWYDSPYIVPGSGLVTKIDMTGIQLRAIAIVEAIERGDLQEAERLYGEGETAGWLDRVIDTTGDKPAVLAAGVIESLKKAYYCAKDRGLVS